MTARRMGTGDESLAPQWVPSDRRRAERIESLIRATVRPIGIDGAPTRARAVDVCDHGVRLICRKRLPPGARVQLDLECELPLRVHLGFAADSLVIDGPMHTHLVRVEARVVRMQRHGSLYELGLEFCPDTPGDDRELVQLYVDHLRDNGGWAI